MINAMLTVAVVALAYVWEAVLGFPLPQGTTPPHPTPPHGHLPVPTLSTARTCNECNTCNSV